MSAELARRAREANKSKAARMAAGDPHAKVDASSWEPPKALDADVQTGERPVSRRQYKRGGKVEGELSAIRADRKARKSGGMTANSYINRDVKDANEERDGKKHVGGFAAGGNVGDTVPTSRLAFTGGESRLAKAAGLKGGGRAKKGRGGILDYLSPAAALIDSGGDGKDKAKILSPIMNLKKGGAVGDGKIQGTRPTGGRIARKQGGSAHWIKDAIGHKGALHKELHVPEGEKIPAKKLEKAEHSKNPKERKRAELAETLKEMRPERASGGRTKGKTNINIIIGQPGGGNAPPPMLPPDGPVPPPPMAAAPKPMPPAPPPMPPQGLAAGPPVGAPPPMPMPRKRGGRTYDAGAGSGEGRLEKIREYGKNA